MLNDKETVMFKNLLFCLELWAKKNKNTIQHSFSKKETGSLYRFGIFKINGYNYSISGWRFDKHIITFENEETGEKIKFDIEKSETIYNRFKKDGFIQSKNKKIRNFISDWLQGLSDAIRI